MNWCDLMNVNGMMSFVCWFNVFECGCCVTSSFISNFAGYACCSPHSISYHYITVRFCWFVVLFKLFLNLLDWCVSGMFLMKPFVVTLLFTSVRNTLNKCGFQPLFIIYRLLIFFSNSLVQVELMHAMYNYLYLCETRSLWKWNDRWREEREETDCSL